MSLLQPIKNLCAAGVVGVGLLMACTSIDCPLDNAVDLTCNLYATETGSALTLTDTLTVRACGTDSVLLNRGISLNTFTLPLRYRSGTDTLLFRFSNDQGQFAVDTLFVEQTAEVHFESEDCPVSFYHTIDQVRWTSHALAAMPLTIDNVEIKRNQVDYENAENLRIYLRATTDE